MPTTTTESDTDNDHHPAGSPSATTKQTHPARSYACHGPNSTYRSGYISSHLDAGRSSLVYIVLLGINYGSVPWMPQGCS